MTTYASNAAAATQLTPFTNAPPTADSTTPATANAIPGLAPGSWLDPLTYGAAFVHSPLWSSINETAETIGLPAFFMSSFSFSQAGFGPLYQLPLMEAGARAAGGFWGANFAAVDSGLVDTGLISDVTGLESNVLRSTLASAESAASGGVSAGVGHAERVGALSVPKSWATTAGVQLATKAIPASGAIGVPQTATGMPGLAGMGGMGGAPVLGSVVDASRNGASASRYGVPSKLVSALPGRTDAAGLAADPGMRAAGGTVRSGPSAGEHHELGELRRIAIELARECEVLDRSATMLLEQVPAGATAE